MALLSSDDQLPRLYPEKDAAFSAGQTGSEGGIEEKTRPGVTGVLRPEIFIVF